MQAGLNGFDWTFVQGSTFVLRLNFSTKIPSFVSTINVSCNANGDYETYDLFKRFFIDIGHDVEDPEHFVLDDINKLKSKYKK